MREEEAELQGSRCKTKYDEESAVVCRAGANNDVLLNAGEDSDLQKPSRKRGIRYKRMQLNDVYF